MVRATPAAVSSAELEALLERARALETFRAADVIPKECYRTELWRGLLGFFASYTLWALGLSIVAFAPHWSLWIPAWLLSGLGGWGLHCIAHDCGHGSFSPWRPFNSAIGHVALLPMLYPFHGWRHVHNLHHAHTNHLEKDTDWRPVQRAVYERMGFKDRTIYWGTRSLFFWLGTAHYQFISGFSTDLFPSARARVEVRRSLAFLILVAGPAIAAVGYFGGGLSILKYVVGPWLAMHAWFSATTLMHHTAEDVPFLTGRQWSKVASNLLLTTDFRYPTVLHFFTHNISIHTPHHVAPKIPFYHLKQAQDALKHALPGVIRERPFTFTGLYRAARWCHLHNPNSGFYSAFDVPERISPDHLEGAGAR
jgi:omega-6 fatty acid desaturase (delta-12 desaturase)